MEISFRQVERDFGFGKVLHNKVFRGDIEITTFPTEEEAREFAREITEYENETALFSDSEIESIKAVSNATINGSHYDSGSGDFVPRKYKITVFDTPLGRVEYWSNGSIRADMTIGWGTPSYPNSPEFDERKNKAIAMRMDGKKEFTSWWKPNTVFSEREYYINKAQRQVLERILEIMG